MLKELNKLWMNARCQAAAWRRWYRKLPHNRVRRTRIRDDRGRPIGYGAAVPIPEPKLPSCFCRQVELPSGRIELFVSDEGIEAAYRVARYPKICEDEVKPLLIAEEDIRRLYGRLWRK